MSISLGIPYNQGEERMHRLLKVPSNDNPTAATLTQQAIYLLRRAPLFAIGTLDFQNRPWTSLWGGSPSFSEALGGGIIGTRTIVDSTHDPVVQALLGQEEKGIMFKGENKMIAGLTINLMTRKRVKIFGRMMGACIEDVEVEYPNGIERVEGVPNKQGKINLVTKVEQSLGNCPKYLNQYEIRPALITSKLVYHGPTLSTDANKLIRESDMFFLSSATDEDMDTNHRGGPPGFVRILSDTEIVYPEYSGNRLYQTLGNLQMNPKIGITFPDYTTGNVLYTTGIAQILIGSDAAMLLPGSNLALKLKLDEVRLVEGGLAFRGTRKESSPYNPLVRPLGSEGNIKATLSSTRKIAQMIGKELLTATVARFTFAVSEGIRYSPGQWIAFDFSEHLDIGYSHMRNDDPRSLNDDFVRTFTISSSPGSETSEQKHFEITIRNVGVVTKFLFRQDDYAGFEVPVIGIGGEFRFETKPDTHALVPFVAGGVGITPLLGQLSNLAISPEHFKLLWTTKSTDANLALDILRKHPALAKCTKIFFTGKNMTSDLEALIEELHKLGAKVEIRRMRKTDTDNVDASTWYLCAGNPLRRELLGWLEGKTVVFENFDY